MEILKRRGLRMEGEAWMMEEFKNRIMGSMMNRKRDEYEFSQ